MTHRLKALCGLLVPIALLGCSDGGSGTSTSTSTVDLRFSDAPVDDLDKVVVTVESIEFARGGESFTVETFAGSGEDSQSAVSGDDAERFTIDLLQVVDNESELVIDGVTLGVGRYDEMRLNIVDDIDSTYVVKADATERTALKVPSGQLKLGGFDVEPTSTQTLMVEFGLRESMTYNPGPDRYILKPRGVRIVGLGSAANLRGTIGTDVRGDVACAGTTFETVYLYTEDGTADRPLGDVFDPDASSGVDAVAPLVAAGVAADGSWFMSYLPDGTYTLAYACSSVDDLPDSFQNIEIPSPIGSLTRILLGAGTETACDLSLDGFACSVTDSVPGPDEDAPVDEPGDPVESPIEASSSVR